MGLIRTPDGWVEPPMPRCPCGEPRFIRSFRFCRCAGAIGGGHSLWICRGCGGERVRGCLGVMPVEP